MSERDNYVKFKDENDIDVDFHAKNTLKNVDFIKKTKATTCLSWLTLQKKKLLNHVNLNESDVFLTK